MTSDNTPRKPTKAEKTELLDLLYFEGDGDTTRKDLAGDISCAFIAVFDHYTTFYPGYWGKVMIVVWGESPQECSAYVWSANGQLEAAARYEQDGGSDT